MKARLYILKEGKEIDESILISSDEISKYNISYKPIVENSESKVNYKVAICIKGKIIRKVSELGISLLDSINISLPQLDGAWNSVSQEYRTQVSSLLNTKYAGVNLSTDALNDNATKYNSENLSKIRGWVDSFRNGSERTVILEVIKNEEVEIHVLENAYVFSYEEIGKSDESNGTFELLVKQRKQFDKGYYVVNS